MDNCTTHIKEISLNQWGSSTPFSLYIGPPVPTFPWQGDRDDIPGSSNAAFDHVSYD